MNCTSEAQNHCGLGVSETKTRGTGLWETRKPGGQVSANHGDRPPNQGDRSLVNHGDRPRGRVVFTYAFFRVTIYVKKT